MFTFDEAMHTGTLDGHIIPSITQVLKAEGFIDTRWCTDWDRDKGSAVHLACHLDDMNDLDESDLDPIIVPYLEAWREFRSLTGFMVEGSETPLVSATFRYFGIPDRWGYISTTRAVIDLKSGPCSPWVALQTAAQALLISPSAHFKRFGLTLKDGKPKITEFTDRSDRGVFLGALASYKWKRNHLKG